MNIVKHYYRHSAWTKRTKTTEIIVHCSATPEGKDYSCETIDQWHRARKFNGIGYHFIIYMDGTIHQGREVDVIGAHCTGHNAQSVGICYIGGLSADGKRAKDTRTNSQKKSMDELITWLCDKYHLQRTCVHGHNEYAAKACPSFNCNELRE